MALAGLKAGAAERDPLIERDAVAEDRGLADDDAGAVVDEEPGADLGGVVDLDPGERPREVGERARKHRHARAVERVGDAMGQHGLDPGPAREHLEPSHAERGRIALARRLDVATHLAHQRVEAVHHHRVATAAGVYAAKNGIDM